MKIIIFALFLTSISNRVLAGIPKDAQPLFENVINIDDSLDRNGALKTCESEIFRQKNSLDKNALKIRCSKVYYSFQISKIRGSRITGSHDGFFFDWDKHSSTYGYSIKAGAYCIERLPSEQAAMSLAKSCIENWKQECSDPNNIKAMNSVKPTEYTENRSGSCE